MADVYISTTGNDTTGNGTFANPYFSPTKAYTITVAGDTMICRGGTYTQTATLVCKPGVLVKSYPGETAIWSYGTYQSTFAAGNYAFQRVGLAASGSGSGTSSMFYAGGLGVTIELDNCPINTSSTRTALAFRSSADSIAILKENTYTGSGMFLQAIGAMAQVSCSKNIINGSSVAISLGGTCLVLNIESNQHINCTTDISWADAAAVKGMLYLYMCYNSFFGSTRNFSIGSTTNATLSKTNIKNNYLGGATVVGNTSTGVLTIAGGQNNYNAYLGTATLGNFTGTNSVVPATLADVKFYSSVTPDLRLELTSPLVLGNADTIGAFLPDYDAFWSDLLETDVKNSVAYRVRSRTNNKTGSYTGSGSGTVTFNQKLLYKLQNFQIDKKIRPGQYDTIAMSLSSGDTVETYVYSLSATTVATLTITYTNSTRDVPISMIWT